MTRLRFRTGTVVLLFVLPLGLAGEPMSRAEQNKAAAGAARKDDHADFPFAIMALASVNRLRERTTHIAQSSGQPQFAAAVFNRITLGLEDLLTLDGLDPSKPMALLTYPKIFREPTDLGSAHVGETTDIIESLTLDRVVQFFVSEPVLCFPARDPERLVAALSKLTETQFKPIPGKPGYFQNEAGEEQPLRRIGPYILYCTDAIHDRDFPDVEKLLKPLLMNHDAVVSLQARGVPQALREACGSAVRLAADAALQRRDGESDLAFRWRTALSSFQRESLELLISHIDEINFGVRLDSTRSEAVFDLDLVGSQNGRWAKACHGLTAKHRTLAFSGPPDEEGPFSLALALALSPQFVKPLVVALRTRPEFGLEANDTEQGIASLGELFRSVASTIETGQLDARLTTHGTPDERIGVFGLRVAGGNGFPAAVQQFLEQHRNAWEFHFTPVAEADGNLTYVVDERPWSLAVDSVDGRPIHRLPFLVVHDQLGAWADRLALPLPRSGSLWITATPQALWCAWSNDKHIASAPPALKTVLQSAGEPAANRATSSRAPVPFQMTLHARDWSVSKESHPNLTSKNRTLRHDALLQQSELLRRQAIADEAFQNRADALRCELRPLSQGLRLRLVLEEGFIAWCGLSLTEDVEQNESTSSDPSGN